MARDHSVKIIGWGVGLIVCLSMWEFKILLSEINRLSAITYHKDNRTGTITNTDSTPLMPPNKDTVYFPFFNINEWTTEKTVDTISKLNSRIDNLITVLKDTIKLNTTIFIRDSTINKLTIDSTSLTQKLKDCDTQKVRLNDKLIKLNDKIIIYEDSLKILNNEIFRLNNSYFLRIPNFNRFAKQKVTK